MKLLLKNKIADFNIDKTKDVIELLFEDGSEDVIDYDNFFSWAQNVDKDEARGMYVDDEGFTRLGLVKVDKEDYPLFRPYDNQLEDIDNYLATRRQTDPFTAIYSEILKIFK